MKIVKFFSEVKQEFKKIVWPSKNEITVSVMIIFVSVTIFGFCTVILDYGIHNIVQFLLNIGK